MPLKIARAPANNEGMDNSTIAALTNALDFGSTRMQAISNNLSNINTPGYKRKDASFAALLEAQDGGDALRTSAQAGGARRLSLDGDTDPSHPAIVTQGGDSARADGNNVDVDAEGARLAQAELFYNANAQMLAGQFSGLKYVIEGR